MKRALDSGALEALALCGALVLLFLVTPFGIEGDGAGRFRLLSRLLTRGEIAVSPYSLIGPLTSAPLWWMGNVYGAIEAWCARFNFFVFILGLAALYWTLTPEIDRRTTVQFLLILTVASMFPHHNSRYYGEVFTAIFVAVGLALVVVKRKNWGWVLAILGTANVPASLIGLAMAAAWVSFRRKTLGHLVPVIVAAAVIMIEAWIRRGSPFTSGYEGMRGAQTVLPFSGRPGFSYPFVFGLLSILFSFGKGIFMFAPGLTLARPLKEWRSRIGHELVVTWLFFLGGLVLLYSKWWGWNGGDFWGPRFFPFASIPAAYLLAEWLRGPRASRGFELLGIGCLMWSVWVGINGLVYGFDGPAICTENHYALELLCWYTPEFSPLFRPFYESRTVAFAEQMVIGYFFAIGVALVATRVLDSSSPRFPEGRPLVADRP